MLTDDDGVIVDEMHTRFSWVDGRMMYQIIELGPESSPVELLDDQRRTGLDKGSPDLWLPLDGSSYVILEGWSADSNNSPYAVDLITYSDLVIEPAPVTTLVEHGWEWNVVPYVGGYTYARDEVDDDGGPTRTTKERTGLSYTAWYHAGTGLLLATDSTKERFLFETNYERHHSSGRLVVHPLGVIRTEKCVLVDTNLNMSGPSTGVPAAGVSPAEGAPGNGETDDDDAIGEGIGADEDGEYGEEEAVDPVAQAAAAGATVLLAGGWLLAETVSGRRRRDESDAPTVPLTEEDRYWEERNRRERAAALRAHQQFADDQWGKFTDRCRDWAAGEAAEAAERRDRQLRMTAAGRLEDMATDREYRDFVEFLDHFEEGTLPSWHQLETMRNGIVKRVGDQAAIDKYYEKSDVRVFLEGFQDTTARGVGKAVGMAHGPILGKGAEWAVRNPLVPLRIGVAVVTSGYSELVFLPFDAWDAMEAAADQKMAEQNRELTYWEATEQVIKTGAWHVGGELVGDGISKISKLRGGGAAASSEATEEAADTAARRASRRAGAQTGDDFVRRVEDSLAAKRAAREAGKELPDAAARRAAEALDHGSNPIRAPRDNYVKNWAKEGELIPRNHLHEAGYTARDTKAASQLCADERVTAYARTTNIDSMRPIRDGTALPKPLDIKAKTIGELDMYLGSDPADKGLVGYFKPVELDLSKVPAELRDAVNKRFTERMDEFAKLSQDAKFQGLLDDRTFRLEGGKIIDSATGKPFAGDIDAVVFVDVDTGKYLTHGPRYDRVMARWRADVGGQHGAEITVVDDVTRRLRPGTPQHAEALESGTSLRDKLQAAHSEEVIVRFDADGGLYRGPDSINLTPSADEILVDVSGSAPAAGSSGPIGEVAGADPPQGTGGAVGSTIGRELEETPDA